MEQAPQSEAKLRNYLSALSSELEREEKERAEQARMLAEYEEAYAKLTSPANRIGVCLRVVEPDRVLVALGDGEYLALVDPMMDAAGLVPGARVTLNEAFAVVGLAPGGHGGLLTKVQQVLEDGRLRVGSDPANQQGKLVARSDALRTTEVRAGDEVMLDAAGRVAVEHFQKQETLDYFVEEVEETRWEAIGGQDEAIRLIRDTIEQPLLYPELYRRFDKKPIKGILLFGPPGCGKTLIGKATAYNLAKEYSGRVGRQVKECFLHISGPKILNMWLGETERMVREIFATARERAKEGQLVVVFLDEAESILRTRSSGRWLNISNTVVPQFCAEMDGLVSLENVVLIITSNRPDYIDPAVLRPERIDRKVKICRPDHDAARAVFCIYLHERLPLDPAWLAEHEGDAAGARQALIEAAVAFLWRKVRETEFVKVALHNGTNDVLHWKDLVSGALIKSVVDRAKDAAIRRAIADPVGEHGVSPEDVRQAIAAEYRENEIFPKSDSVEDWLKLLDLEPESVAAVKPIRPSKDGARAQRAVI